MPHVIKKLIDRKISEAIVLFFSVQVTAGRTGGRGDISVIFLVMRDTCLYLEQFN